MRIHDIMTPSPAYCLPSDSAQTAAQLMAQYDTGILPVVESLESRRVVGVVTDRDLCLTVLGQGKSPLSTPVMDSMTTPVISCRPDDDVRKIEALMRDYLVRRIPVVEGSQAIRGMVSIADLALRSDSSAERVLELLRELSKPTQQASKPRAMSAGTEAETPRPRLTETQIDPPRARATP